MRESGQSRSHGVRRRNVRARVECDLFGLVHPQAGGSRIADEIQVPVEES
jgi:hypothetical protein